MSPAAVLKKARELISDEKAWTKGALARDYKGSEVEPETVDAVCFCAAGAVSRSTPVPGWQLYRRALEVLDLVSEPSDIVSFNDAPERTHAEVLAAFDKAIASAEAGGGE